MFYSMFLTVFALACADAPVAPVVVEEAAWCGEGIELIEGVWEGKQTRQGHLYRITLRLDVQEPCVFLFRYETRLNEDNHENTLVYLTTGIIVIIETQYVWDKITTFVLESKQYYREQIDAEGNSVIFDDDYLFPSQFGKVWDNNMILWDTQFRRVVE